MLTRYGMTGRARDEANPFAITMGSWAQIVRSLNSRTDDYDQSLVYLFNTPAVQRDGIRAAVVTEILSRVAMLTEGGGRLVALRVLVDEARVVEIEHARDEHRVELIDTVVTEKQDELADQFEAQQLELHRVERERDEAQERLAVIRAKYQSDVEASKQDAAEAMGSKVQELESALSAMQQRLRLARYIGAAVLAVATLIGFLTFIVTGIATDGWSLVADVTGWAAGWYLAGWLAFDHKIAWQVTAIVLAIAGGIEVAHNFIMG